MYNLFTIWLFYVVAQRAGGAIVVIVALAILVALGAAALVGYLLMLMIPYTKKR